MFVGLVDFQKFNIDHVLLFSTFDAIIDQLCRKRVPLSLRPIKISLIAELGRSAYHLAHKRNATHSNAHTHRLRRSEGSLSLWLYCTRALASTHEGVLVLQQPQPHRDVTEGIVQELAEQLGDTLGRRRSHLLDQLVGVLVQELVDGFAWRVETMGERLE